MSVPNSRIIVLARQINSPKTVASTFIVCTCSYILYRYIRLRWTRLFYIPIKLHHNFSQIPDVLPYFPSAILLALFKSQGKNYFEHVHVQNKHVFPKKGSQLQDSKFTKHCQLSVGINSIHIDADHLKSYIQCTQFPLINNLENLSINTNTYTQQPKQQSKSSLIIPSQRSQLPIPLPLPLCYFEAMRFPLSLQVLLYDRFPLSPLGIVHMKTEIKQYNKRINNLLIENDRVLMSNENWNDFSGNGSGTMDISIDKLTKLELKMETCFSNMIETNKGIEFELITSVFSRNFYKRECDILIYYCKETFLSRNVEKLKQFKQTQEYQKKQANVECLHVYHIIFLEILICLINTVKYTCGLSKG